MRKKINRIFWLEDDRASIIQERNKVKQFCNKIIIKESIQEFVHELETCEPCVGSNDIIILDMMINDNNLEFNCKINGHKEKITINNISKAGLTLHLEYLKKEYNSSPVIYYTFVKSFEEVKKYANANKNFFIYQKNEMDLFLECIKNLYDN